MRASTLEIYQALKGEIEQSLRLDAPLPPERELCERYRVGRSAIRTALRQLELDGLIRTDRRGLRQVAGVPNGLRKVFVVCSGNELFQNSAEQIGLLSGISNEIYASGGEIVPVLSDHDRVLADFCNHYDRETHSGIIFIENSSGQWYNKSMQLGIPTIVANQEQDGNTISSRMNFREIGRMGGRILLERGYRRIALLGRGPGYVTAEMVAGLRGALAEEKIWFDDDHIVFDNYYTKDQAENAGVMNHLQQLLSRADAPDAFLVFRLPRARRLMALAQERSLRIPQDFGLLVYDVPGWNVLHDLEPSMLLEPVEPLGRAAVQMLKEWLAAGHPPKSRELLPEFADHQTLPCRTGRKTEKELR